MNLQLQENVNRFQAKLCIRNWKLWTFRVNVAARSDGINKIPSVSYSFPIAPNGMLTPVVHHCSSSKITFHFVFHTGGTRDRRVPADWSSLSFFSIADFDIFAD
jgi:hypothetical protein